MEDEQRTLRERDNVAGVYDIDEQLSLDVARRRQCLGRALVSNNGQGQSDNAKACPVVPV